MCQSIAIRRINEVIHCRMSKVMFVFLILMFLSTNFVLFWSRSTFLVYEPEISVIEFYTCEDIKTPTYLIFFTKYFVIKTIFVFCFINWILHQTNFSEDQ